MKNPPLILQTCHLRIRRIFQWRIRSFRKILLTFLFVVLLVPYLIFTSSQYNFVSDTTSYDDEEGIDDATSTVLEDGFIDSLSTNGSTNNRYNYGGSSVKARQFFREFMSTFPNYTFCVESIIITLNRTGTGSAASNYITSNETRRSRGRSRLFVEHGGWWKPVDCIARHTTGIIIPYRDRKKHLAKLLKRLHSVLQTQLISYRIFVVEQNDTDLFNKGALLNTAFLFIRDYYRTYADECIVFHDVDLIPEDERNIYTCPEDTEVPAVRHMSPGVDKLKYVLPYPELVGGVLAINPRTFVKVNGYSNLYRGWGGEDDDMYERLHAEGIEILRPPSSIGRYKMLPHPGRPRAENRYRLLRYAKQRYKKDGLNSLFEGKTYNIVSVQEMPAYTHIVIALSGVSSKTKCCFHIWCLLQSACFLLTIACLLRAFVC